MSVTVTIHKGEMKQIKRLIDENKKKKKKSAKGQLYGLWTHSFQPVIQYVIGDPSSEHEKKIKNYLWENHGLKHLGNWSTGGGDITDINDESPSFVNMTVESTDDKTLNVKLCAVSEKGSNHKNELKGVIEMLDGDSVFRLNAGPFTKDSHLACYHNKEVPGPLELAGQSSNEAKTKKEQWYSTEEGMQLFGKIHGALQQQFEITGTSRDTKTHDISLTLKYHGREYIVDFPVDFPKRMAVLSSGKSKQEISLTEKKSGDEQKSGERGKRPNNSSKVTSPGSGTSQKQKEKEVTQDEQDDSSVSANKSASLPNETEPQQELDREKVPELLTQGILGLVQVQKGSMGTTV